MGREKGGEEEDRGRTGRREEDGSEEDRAYLGSVLAAGGPPHSSTADSRPERSPT